MAAASLLAGVVVGALYVPGERTLADRFGAAWQRGDYAAMHRLLSDTARDATPLGAFEDAYRQARVTATATSIQVGRARDPEHGVVPLPVRLRTRIFGVIRGTVELPFSGEGEDLGVAWQPRLTFPGVAHGQRLARRTEMPPRGTLLARDGEVLAKGPDRASAIPGAASQVVGELGPIPDERRQELRALGYPDDASVGKSGLELAFDRELSGTPGGSLLVGPRVIATARSRAGRSVRTTISPELQQATIGALGARNGAVAVLRPTSGEVLALAGPAYSGLSPPGSTFKLITTTAALEDGKVKLDDTFPVDTAAVLEGVRLENANGESCGGSFENSFAHSCNSVFAPLGVKVGPERLVEVAEKYGFNRKPAIPAAAMSTIPPADQIGDDLAVGSTAIGQGKVQTSALAMASAAATIANRGVRAEPTLRFGARAGGNRVTSPEIAAKMRSLMVGVVKSGTGTSAALPNVTVAGKTGTAELGGGPGGANIPGNTDAWFVAFAPARAPRLAVGVVMYRAGAGGAAAAPVVRAILASALEG
jgi:cell division protein FtsI/penicillin-binding protein 2